MFTKFKQAIGFLKSFQRYSTKTKQKKKKKKTRNIEHIENYIWHENVIT